MNLWVLGFQGLLAPILVDIKSVLKGWIAFLKVKIIIMMQLIDI